MSAGSRGGPGALWGVDVLTEDPDTGTSGRRYLVLPSVEEPRLVLPTRPHRAAGTILSALRDKTSWGSRLRTAAARAVLTTGARGIHLPDPDLLSVVTAELPADEYVYGVHLGPPRANRKPVLALATPRGDLAAFVKYGVDDLTDRLVRREASALAMLADLSSVRVPRLIAAGEHRGHPFVIQSPVATTCDDSHRSGGGDHGAGRGGCGRTRVDRLPSSPRGNRAALAAPGRRVRRVRRCLVERHCCLRRRGSALGAGDGDTSVPWGSWHGDWRRTNMAVTADGCSVWDWERFESGVPAGYDALHLFLTARAPAVRDLTSLPTDLYDNAARLLRPFGVHTRRDVELVTTGYLLELAGRYLDDDQTHAGARLGSVGEWLLPHLSRMPAGRPSPDTGRGVNES